MKLVIKYIFNMLIQGDLIHAKIGIKLFIAHIIKRVRPKVCWSDLVAWSANIIQFKEIRYHKKHCMYCELNDREFI